VSTPVDHDLALRLRVAEARWLAQCASRLRRARARPEPRTSEKHGATR